MTPPPHYIDPSTPVFDPATLKKTRYEGKTLLHATAVNDCFGIERFSMMLNAGLKHYPEDLGFLFQTNDDGETVCELAFNTQGIY